MSDTEDFEYQLQQQSVEDARAAVEGYKNSSETFDWTKPPSDVNSEEYRQWHEEYCRQYALQQSYLTAYANTSSGDTTVQTTSTVEASETLTTAVAESSSDNLLNPEIPENVNLPQDVVANKLKSNEDIPEKKGKKRKHDKSVNIDQSKTKAVNVKGLPSDITEKELIKVMSKAGHVGLDPHLRTPRVTIHRNENGEASGEARYFYMRPESVELAITLLDDTEVRPDVRITVERLTILEMIEEFEATKKKKKLTKAETKMLKEAYNKVTAWESESETETETVQRPMYERVCVVKNVFLPEQIDEDPTFIEVLKTEMTEECQRFGKLKKVVIHKDNGGTVLLYFKTPEQAAACIKVLNGRWFDKRQLEAFHWDGKTQYVVKIEETEEEKEARAKNWDTFLDEE